MICSMLSAVKAINTTEKTHMIFLYFCSLQNQSCKSGGSSLGKCSLGTSVFILSFLEGKRGLILHKQTLYEKLCFRLDSLFLREQLNQFTPKLNCKGGIINDGKVCLMMLLKLQITLELFPWDFEFQWKLINVLADEK